MSAIGRQPAIGTLFTLVVGAGVMWVATAIASEPVAKVIIGCVVNGAYISSDGYRISPRYQDGREVDLRSFEGREVTIDGFLLPGDHFIVKKAPRDSGLCQAK
jgi:hypothetical protein